MTPMLTHLSRELKFAPPAKSLVVALSGGIDSVTLLHGLHLLQRNGELNHGLRAIHVNHGLQDAAPAWQAFCEDFCAGRDIPLVCKPVVVSKRGSLENAARESRYQAFAETLLPEDLLLLAHHLDDQLETFLLRLQRGAGIAGLTAMPNQRPLGKGWLYRPLLSVTRQFIKAFAEAESLHWVEEQSNQDTRYDRNFLRAELLPVVESRWPHYRASWQKSIALLTEAATVLTELAGQDFQAAQINGSNPGHGRESAGQGFKAAQGQASLSCAELSKLSTPRLRNLLRWWLKQHGGDEPGWHQLQSITQKTLQHRQHGILLETPQFRIQIYADSLYLLRQGLEPDLPAAMTLELPSAQNRADQRVAFGHNGVLHLQITAGTGISSKVQQLQVRLRAGGEEIRLPGRPLKTLKKLFQEQQVPPWLRQRTPLLYAGETLIAVPGIGIAEGWQAQAGEEGITISWEPPPL